MKSDDFAEVMKEIVPQLVDQALQSQLETETPAAESTSSSSSRPTPTKRERDEGAAPPEEPQAKSGRFPEEDEVLLAEVNESVTFACDEMEVLAVESLSCPEVVQSRLTSAERQSLLAQWQAGCSSEQLVASYMQKKASKELPCTGNAPEVQKRIDEAKLLEWNTILSKNAARLIHGPEALEVRQRFKHRIMGSRYVITVKQEEDAPARMKARWCLLG